MRCKICHQRRSQRSGWAHRLQKFLRLQCSSARLRRAGSKRLCRSPGFCFSGEMATKNANDDNSAFPLKRSSRSRALSLRGNWREFGRIPPDKLGRTSRWKVRPRLSLLVRRSFRLNYTSLAVWCECSSVLRLCSVAECQECAPFTRALLGRRRALGDRIFRLGDG